MLAEAPNSRIPLAGKLQTASVMCSYIYICDAVPSFEYPPPGAKVRVPVPCPPPPGAKVRAEFGRFCLAIISEDNCF